MHDMYEITQFPSGRVKVRLPGRPARDFESLAQANGYILKHGGVPVEIPAVVEPKAEPVVDLEPEPDPDASPAPKL